MSGRLANGDWVRTTVCYGIKKVAIELIIF
jgi:hypothetical protein